MTSMPNQPGLQSPDFLVFSDDWGEHPSSCQHIFRHIAKDHRVLWVNTIGMRNPTLSWTDLHKIALKGCKMLRFRRERGRKLEREGHLNVCQPVMLPFARLSFVRAFNAWSVTRRVRAAMRAMNLRDPTVVTTVPNAADYPRLLEGRRVIYYCVDDFSLWPGLDSQLVRRMEQRLVAQSAAVVAVSNALGEKFKSSGKPVHVLTHGVDLEHFGKPATVEHPVLEGIPRPRIGFFGLIDGRFDAALISEVARQIPEISFVFAGPTDASVDELPAHDNVHFVGAIAYTELPAFIRGMRALILPYKPDGLAKMLSPLKLKEYLATGKPVISTPIGATEEWGDMVNVAKIAEEWVVLIHRLANSTPGESGRATDARLLSQSWARKASELLEVCRRSDRTAAAKTMRGAAAYS